MSAKMYKVNEIFHSVQAEGRNCGRSAVFVRFSGCNLKCPFCDTNHEPYREMTKEQIEAEVEALSPRNSALTRMDDTMIVFTGGEPTLQLCDEEELCAGRFRAMETNGILAAPHWMDWITVSPKTKLDTPQLLAAHEVKVLYGWFKDEYLEELARRLGGLTHLYLQPTADRDNRFDPAPAIEFLKRHPQWVLSLQWHKMFNVR